MIRFESRTTLYIGVAYAVVGLLFGFTLLSIAGAVLILSSLFL